MPNRKLATVESQRHGRVLVALRERSGLTQTELAYRFGVSENAWRMRERGITPLSLEDVPRVAELFALTPDQLVSQLGYGPSPEPDVATRVEPETVEEARAAVPPAAPALGAVRFAPVVAAASAGAAGWEYTGSFLPVSDVMTDALDVVAVRVDGDCLADDLRDGDYAIVDRQRRDPRPGQVVFVIGESNLLKRFERRGGRPVLVDNAGNEFEPDGARVEGVVVGVYRPFTAKHAAEVKLRQFQRGERPALRPRRRDAGDTARELRAAEESARYQSGGD